MMLTHFRSTAAMKMMILAPTYPVSASAQHHAKVCLFIIIHLESH